MGDVDPQNLRRSQRVLLQAAVLIDAEMADGTRVGAQALTQVVSTHGGRLDAPFRMTVGRRITLVNLQSGEEAGTQQGLL